MISFNTLNHLRKKLLLWSSFYRWENCCIKRLCNWSQVPQLASPELACEPRLSGCRVCFLCPLPAPCSSWQTWGWGKTLRESSQDRGGISKRTTWRGQGRITVGFVRGSAIGALAHSSMGKRRGPTRRSASLSPPAFPLCPAKPLDSWKRCEAPWLPELTYIWAYMQMQPGGTQFIG